MSERVARTLGAVAALVLVGGFFLWQRAKPRECTGGVFVELRPPLLEPGPYRFELELDGERRCEFEVTPRASAATKPPQCGIPLELATRVNGTEHSIVGVTLGATPEKLRLRIRSADEQIYDTVLEPTYAPYPTHRDDSKRFCGDRAFVKPECLRGSSQCAPYKASCTGPASCTEGKVCCASPEWGREYGAKSATECSKAERCLSRFGRVVCERDEHCPSDMRCTDSSVSSEYQPPLRACAAKTP